MSTLLLVLGVIAGSLAARWAVRRFYGSRCLFCNHRATGMAWSTSGLHDRLCDQHREQYASIIRRWEPLS